MWCLFKTYTTGTCGKWISGIGSDRCDRHKGMKEKPPKNKQPKFRGYSKYQVVNGMFNNKEE